MDFRTDLAVERREICERRKRIRGAMSKSPVLKFKTKQVRRSWANRRGNTSQRKSPNFRTTVNCWMNGWT